MANMTLTKTPMPEQEPQVRAHNFKEVALGYTAEMAMEEAGRCLNCKKPKCVEGCPVNVRIPEFIAKVHEGDFKAAYEIITSTNALPALSGRVCPQESQCESKCVRGIKGESVAIGRLERFVADWYRENVNAMPEKAASNGIKVAVVGSGPAGLTCAAELAQKGYCVSIFEALHTAGGVLVYGIPEFRLPKAIVANEVEKLKAMAGPTVEFLGGGLSDEEVRSYYLRAKAFLFPGEEDFGITPVEAQSAGTPVLAYGRGGACESVVPGKTGYWFKEQTVESLADCIERFERDGVAYSKEEIREHSRSFSEERFERELKEYCERRMADWQQELLDCSHWEKEELD